MSAALSYPKPLLNASFWSVIDIDQTFAQSMRELKMQYNAALPSRAGRLRSGEITTMKILVHLLCEEMEKLRTARPRDYEFYMSAEMDALPIKTNRGQLRTMMDNEVSLATFSNYINRLMAADFILRKRNTSRVIQEVKDAQGKNCKIITLSPNGRGDFILFINKKALTFKHFYEKHQPEPENRNFSSIENQAVANPKSQSFEQPHNRKLNTNKIDHNICGTCAEGVDKSTIDAVDSLALRNEEGSSTIPLSFPREKPSKVSIQKAMLGLMMKWEDKSSMKSQRERISDRGKDYLGKFKKDWQIQKKLPGRELEFYATLLYFQLRQQIYPQYSDASARRLEPHAKNLLRLHLLRLKSPHEHAFQTLSRAIQMVHTYINTKPGAFVYGMLSWLRLDDQYQTGNLKTVVEQWIPKEQQRLQIHQKQNTQLVKWQYAMHFSNQLFLDFTRALKEGFSKGLSTYQQAFHRLDTYTNKYELPPKLRDKIKKQFADRTYSILQEIRKLE